MSFKSIIKAIFDGVVKAEPTLESLTKIIFPQTVPLFAAVVDPIFAKVQADIVTVEAAKPIGTPGNIASDAVIASFETGLDIAQGIAAAEGKVVVYDKLALQTGINAGVTFFNQMAIVKTSIQIVPLSQVPAGMTVANASGVGTVAAAKP